MSFIRWFFGDRRYIANLMILAFGTEFLVLTTSHPEGLVGVGAAFALIYVRYRRWSRTSGARASGVGRRDDRDAC